MRTISISISHNNYTIIITIFNFKVSTVPAPIVWIIVLISSFLKISSRRAFSVLITLPRILLGQLEFAVSSVLLVPAELPSTKYNSFFQCFYFVQVLIYQIAKCLYACFSYLNEHLHELLYVQLPLCLLA